MYAKSYKIINTNINLPIFDFYFWENLLHQRHLETTYTSWRQKILSGSIKTICILHNTFICIPCSEPFDSFHRIFYELKILQRQILTIITWSDKLVSTYSVSFIFGKLYLVFPKDSIFYLI